MSTPKEKVPGPATSPRLDEAFAFAHALHREQVRKGANTPYVAHLMAVAARVLEAGGDEELAIAGLLHDAVEDQGGEETGARILERFGRRVHHVVMGCTDAVVEPKPPWRARKEAYVAHLRDADADTKVVSASDKLHNARAIVVDAQVSGDALWSRFTAPREEVAWYYGAILTALEAGASGADPRVQHVLSDLRPTVAALRRAAGVAG